MNPYNILIDIIDQAIVDDDLTELETNLSRLSFEQLNQANLDLLLSHFINLCTTTDTVKIIFKVWYKYLDIETGQLDHLTRLFTDITVHNLDLVAKSFDYGAEYYFDYLIDYDALPMTMIAAKNLEQLFTLNNEQWEYLFSRSVQNELKKGYTNHLIKDFIENKLTETRQYTDKPKWVDNVYNVVPNFKFLKNSVELNFEESLKLTLKEISNEDVVKLLGENQLETYLEANHNQKMKLLKPHLLAMYRYQMNFDDNIFRVFGPANTQINEIADLKENHICTKYGGHRALSCKCYEDVYINDEIVDNMEDIKVDWFTGRCDQCFNPIKHKHYALRKPIANGGWKGTYCSFKCVRIEEDDPMVNTLIDIFEDQIIKIGIQDRK